MGLCTLLCGLEIVHEMVSHTIAYRRPIWNKGEE